MTRLTRTLAAIRPVTTSQLLGTWLHARADSFTLDEAVGAVEAELARLPPRSSSIRSCAVIRARWFALRCRGCAKWEILERDGDRYRVAARRRHPQFPFVEDILAYHARFLEETVENAAYA